MKEPVPTAEEILTSYDGLTPAQKADFMEKLADMGLITKEDAAAMQEDIYRSSQHRSNPINTIKFRQ